MKQRYLFLSKKVAEQNSLFKGIWIRWHILTTAERWVCANIVLLPVWWLTGLSRYMPVIILLAIAVYKGLHLKRPSFSVAALLAFSGYHFVGSLLFKVLSSEDISLTWLLRLGLFWFPIALLLWYIQSNNIKLRPEVVAWAFSVGVLQMIGFWLVVHFIFNERPYVYPRALFSLLTNNAEDTYEAGNGLNNYLMPYDFDDKALGGLARWSFFFHFPKPVL